MYTCKPSTICASSAATLRVGDTPPVSHPAPPSGIAPRLRPPGPPSTWPSNWRPGPPSGIAPRLRPPGTWPSNWRSFPVPPSGIAP